MKNVYFTSQRNLKVNLGINQGFFYLHLFEKNETLPFFPIPLINQRMGGCGWTFLMGGWDA